jgi:hypothetical protein
MTKTKLLKLIRSERKAFEELLEGLDQEKMLQPTLDGDWSVKDILAHITTWERRMVQWMEETMQGERPQMLPPGMTWDDLDLWNEQTYLEQKDLPLPTVLSNFHSSFTQVLEIVEAIPEEDLIDPERFEWRQGKPLWQIVSANTHWHYTDHREQIEAWLKDTTEDQ